MLHGTSRPSGPTPIELPVSVQLFTGMGSSLIEGSPSVPRYQIDIQKGSGPDNYWTNVYHLQVDSYAEAEEKTYDIVDYEKSIHTAYVDFLSARIKQVGTAFGVSRILPLTGNGVYPHGTGDILPPFNTLRVDFGVTLGLPGRKYLRVYPSESMITGSNFNDAYLVAVQDNYANLLVAITGFVSPDGLDYTSGVAKKPIQMRQLRRGSKRKAKPVIPLA